MGTLTIHRIHKPRLLKVAATLAAVVLPGCATILSGTTDRAHFRTRDRALEGAQVVVGTESYVIPSTIVLPNSVSEVTVRHPDFDPVVVRLERRFRVGMLVLDILFTPGFGLSGILVDGCTGAWFAQPPTVTVDLNRGIVVEGGMVSRRTAATRPSDALRGRVGSD
jgi:hypothetical protein